MNLLTLSGVSRQTEQIGHTYPMQDTVVLTTNTVVLIVECLSSLLCEHLHRAIFMTWYLATPEQLIKEKKVEEAMFFMTYCQKSYTNTFAICL